jgi:hypothetical protein
LAAPASSARASSTRACRSSVHPSKRHHCKYSVCMSPPSPTHEMLLTVSSPPAGPPSPPTSAPTTRRRRTLPLTVRSSGASTRVRVPHVKRSFLSFFLSFFPFLSCEPLLPKKKLQDSRKKLVLLFFISNLRRGRQAALCQDRRAYVKKTIFLQPSSSYPNL